MDGKVHRLASLSSAVTDNADYAYLSVHLPQATCDKLAPAVSFEPALEGKDCMLVGSRRPFLSSQEDGKRLEKYARECERLQEEFRVQMEGESKGN